jgi:hypothetical protein
MKIAVADIERKYREMTDEQLLALRPKDLTAEARLCYGNESAARGLPIEAVPDEPAVENLSALTKGDSRKPVLYLRSFWVDEQRRQNFIGVQRPQSISSEALFLLPFRKIGPVVAINPPSKDERPWSTSYANPAVRMQPSDDWQRLFFDVLGQAQFVVIHAGFTPSLLWEIEQVFSHEPFVPTFLMIPTVKGDFVPAFGEIIKSTTGMRLPKAFFSSPVIYFPRRNRVLPIASSVDDQMLNQQLHTFVGPLSRVLETIQPGVRSSCVEAARSVRRINVWMAVGLATTSLAFYLMMHGCQ